MTDHFARPKKTIAWARSAIGELDTELAAFFGSNQCEEIIDLDTKPGHKIVKVRIREQLPDSAARKATEALTNTRHAFDQIVYAACSALEAKPKSDVHFPWGTTPTDVRRRMEGKALIPPSLWSSIEELEPYPKGEGYPGGDDKIRALSIAANCKHTIGIEPVMRLAGVLLPTVAGTLLPGQEMAVGPKWDAAKREMLLAMAPADMHVAGDYELHALVVFDDTTAARGMEVVPALTAFVDYAEKSLDRLERRCAEINCAR